MILEMKVAVMDQSMFAGEGGSDPSHWNIYFLKRTKVLLFLF